MQHPVPEIAARQTDGQPPSPWKDLSLEQWGDWRWQLANRLNTSEDFEKIIQLTEEEKQGLDAEGIFRVEVTPYFASLIDPEDPNCPIRRQVIPTSQELTPFEASQTDSLSEDLHSPVPGLVHRYPDRVLMLLTTQCASYCRFCTRSRIVGDPSKNFGTENFQRMIDYITETPQIRDIQLSGGDPLVLPEKLLKSILEQLYAIPHIEIVRINTRVPIFLPQRITDQLVEMLSQFKPLWMNININHPREVSPELSTAMNKLADAGIPLGSQSVLMAGINDCPNIFLDLVHKLVINRVRPYYIYQCDLVPGAGHFRTPISKGIEIIEALRGHTSGYAVPTYVIDSPEGGGKVPVQPNYLLSMSDSKIIVRNYEGFISAYTQPDHYNSHDPSSCPSCRERSGKPAGGVAGLLSGKATTIKPVGWDADHKR
ncbi:MAG: KamA family radical SAM protein [Chloroflexota bacterium]